VWTGVLVERGGCLLNIEDNGKFKDNGRLVTDKCGKPSTRESLW